MEVNLPGYLKLQKSFWVCQDPKAFPLWSSNNLAFSDNDFSALIFLLDHQRNQRGPVNNVISILPS